MNPVQQINSLGQSIWYDNIRRALIEMGDLQKLFDKGVTGVTSNPTIFEKAIAGSMDYDADIQRFSNEGKSAQEIYEALAIADIARGADLLRPVFEKTNHMDGYISLEVSPTLAHDTVGTVAEGKRLARPAAGSVDAGGRVAGERRVRHLHVGGVLNEEAAAAPLLGGRGACDVTREGTGIDRSVARGDRHCPTLREALIARGIVSESAVGDLRRASIVLDRSAESVGSSVADERAARHG